MDPETNSLGTRTRHSCLSRTFEVADSRCERICILTSPRMLALGTASVSFSIFSLTLAFLTVAMMGALPNVLPVPLVFRISGSVKSYHIVRHSCLSRTFEVADSRCERICILTSPRDPETNSLGTRTRRKPADEEDLSVPWTCEDADPFTPRIRNFKSSRKTRMPNNVITYDGTGDSEDHLKIFQAAAQRDGDTIEEFMERFKIETGRIKGTPESKGWAGVQQVYPLTRTPKEIFAAESGKFKPPLPMLRKQIEELVRAGKLSHFIKEIRQDRDQQKTGKKDAPVKDKVPAIYMIQPWQRVTRQKVTQSFACVKEVTFPPLTDNKGTECLLVIKAEIGGHAVHRIYVDEGFSMEVLYEHCFNRLRLEIKSQMVPTITSLTGFSGETIWPLGQLRLLVTIGDAEDYRKAWMNFMIVRSPSLYNGIIGRPGIREFQAVPSTAHEMLKFSVNGEIVTIRSTILTPTECPTIAATPKDSNGIDKSTNGIMHTLEGKIRYIRMAVVQHDGSTTIDCRALTRHPRRIFPCQTEKKGQAPECAKAIQVESSRRNVPRIHDQFGRDKIVPRQDGGRVAAPILSDNQREYEALIAVLRIAAQIGVRNVHMRFDSKLVANQVIGTYVTKEENMIKYLEKAKILISGFSNLSISQVPRSKNKKADDLSKIASTSFAHLSKQVLVEVLKEKSIQEREMAIVVEKEGPTWMTPIIEYLRDGTLLDNRKEARKLFIKARQYELLGGILYMRSFLKPWLSQVKKFVWDNIVCHFGLPDEIVSDNERGNGSLGERIKARLGEGNKNWLEKLPHVLWAHRTMIKSSNNDTSFSLTYGTEAVIPVKIKMPTYHTTVVDAVHNDEELRLNLDLLEERRERAAIREAKAKLKMTKYYNARVRGVTFRPGDFIYRSNKTSHVVDGGKLGLKWEGPYEVTEALGDRAYKLGSTDGTVISRTWNIANLKKGYL
nr:reverse transcriptase domain-containing protein [Tanacetum cinerariifolium]